MKILLFSDSHGNTSNMLKAIKKNKGVSMVIHLGDCVRDILKVREIHGELDYRFVSGNNDWSREYPTEQLLKVEGKRLFITHGHHYNVKQDYQRIAARGRAASADAVFFGHTHKAEEFFSDGMLVLNPGSIGTPPGFYGSNPIYCLVELYEDRIIPRFAGIG